MKKFLLIIGIVIVLIVGISLVVLYNLGDRILDEMISAEFEKKLEASLDSELDKQLSGNESLNEVVPTPMPEGEIANSESAITEENSREDQITKPEVATDKSIPTSKLKESVKTTLDKSKTVPDEENVIRSSEGIEVIASPAPSHIDDESKIGVQKIVEIKDQITITEKIEAAAMVLRRLSPSDIDSLIKMLSSGISNEERGKAKELIFKRFTDEEIQRIYSLYIKYMHQEEKREVMIK